MVTRGDISRWRLVELSDGNLLHLLDAIRKNGNFWISIPRAEAVRYLVQSLDQAGYSIDEIAYMLDMKPSRVRKIVHATKNYTIGFKNALKLFRHHIDILRKSDTYCYRYYVSRINTETALIEELIRAGWTVSQVVMATGFGRRRVQRAAKRVRESDGQSE